MRPSFILRATQQRVPLIKFIGKRTPPKSVDHTPHAHPASPTHELPDSFAQYRSKAQQHGPLKGGNGNGGGGSVSASPFQAATSGPMTYGAVGGTAGRSLGPVQPKDGEYFDRNELPKRFWRTQWSEEEIEAVSSGGASMFG
ncbi:hypothetical protein LTR99_002870 [Exophiala xenobiotica]|uniref:Uncharacterized protein n=1 Tax=Vermiconidia calcicola TaxID=1690605 RepID=A0AAV9QD73_9PEZI|nr:hypothetical protein LTR99_002870 [Exophiala xenobiotica]KAK5426368.1 hypothetical protein LTR34_010054 [Exophiala xenobiotica]KAK5538540.1 hypothetical protein LTR25_004082 [Vermiconidia calcicola]KAK5547972.1 hypothetical protein LTR23_002221 [Chaetothyriales sp. CCFEE 6169]KAK5557291.1 hypothetical protein LTR46_004317 [Exophiala xenobiotica]